MEGVGVGEAGGVIVGVFVVLDSAAGGFVVRGFCSVVEGVEDEGCVFLLFWEIVEFRVCGVVARCSGPCSFSTLWGFSGSSAERF